MKESFHFPHDYNARGDVNIVRMRRTLGWSAYGLYWALIEKSGEEGNFGRLRFEDVDDMAYDFHTDTDTLMRIIGEFNLFARDKKGEYFWSRRFIAHLKKRQEIASLRAELGRRGGLAKAKQKLEQNPSKPEANSSKVKESKGKEKKVNKAYPKKTFSDLVLENEFCDHGYLDKLREQIPRCKKEDIENIKRKTEVIRNCVLGGKIDKAKIIFHEIAGLVNDSQQQKLSDV